MDDDDDGESSGSDLSEVYDWCAETEEELLPKVVRQRAKCRPCALPFSPVKDTFEVDKKRATLPKFAHPLPTCGDFLKKRTLLNNYILLDVIGTGSFAEVRLVKDKLTEQFYALKILKKKMTLEIDIMKKLNHRNVIRLFEVMDDPKLNKLYLVLEYMRLGDLMHLLNGDSTKCDPMSETQVWHVFRQVAVGLEYVHQLKIAHGDIKPQNLLVGERSVIKIADFGISRLMNDTSKAVTTGTPAFLCPESWDGNHTASADIWAFGASMFMLALGRPPFLADNLMNLYYKILNEDLQFPTHVNGKRIILTEKLKDLLKSMLTKKAENRTTISEILQNPWLRLPPIHHRTKIPLPTNRLCISEEERRIANFKATTRKKMSSPDVEEDDDDVIKNNSYCEDDKVDLGAFKGPLKNVEQGLIVAYHSQKGPRPSQEDRVTVIPDLAALGGKGAYFGIFDGHNGTLTATILQHSLHDFIIEKSTNLRDTMGNAFRNCDKKVTDLLEKHRDQSGSAALCALIVNQTLVVAHAGDSRGILVKKDGIATDLTKDHRLRHRKDERDRINNAGGCVINNRLNGILALSRSFGDLAHRNGPSAAPTLTAVPEITILTINPDDELLIFATDGLWDALTSQQATNFIRHTLSTNDGDLQLTAKAITHEAIKQGSSDNVTVIIVALNQQQQNS